MQSPRISAGQKRHHTQRMDWTSGGLLFQIPSCCSGGLRRRISYVLGCSAGARVLACTCHESRAIANTRPTCICHSMSSRSIIPSHKPSTLRAEGPQLARVSNSMRCAYILEFHTHACQRIVQWQFGLRCPSG